MQNGSSKTTYNPTQGEFSVVDVYFHFSVLKYVSRTVKIIVDNGYLQKGYPDLELLISRIMKYTPDAAIGLDSNWSKTLYVKRKFPDVKIVYPIHYESDLNNVDIDKIDYVGYPTLHAVRHFSLKWYLNSVPREKRFLLGLTLKDIPLLVKHFAACDTVIVQFNAYYGKDLFGRKRFRSFAEGLKHNIQQLYEIIRKHEKQQTLEVVLNG